MLFDHRVLTTDQVVDQCFTNPTTARVLLAAGMAVLAGHLAWFATGPT